MSDDCRSNVSLIVDCLNVTQLPEIEISRRVLRARRLLYIANVRFDAVYRWKR